jgi:hypothetical protein
MFGSALDRRKHPDLARQADAACGEVVGAIRDAQRRGALGSGDPELIAEVMWALTFGIARLGSSSQLPRTALPAEALAVQGVRWVSDGCQMGV